MFLLRTYYIKVEPEVQDADVSKYSLHWTQGDTEPNSLTVTSPNDGEIWAVGTVQNITWSKSGNTGSHVKLEYSTDSGSSWEPIETSVPNDKSYPWPIPDDASTICRVKVTSTSNSSINDISNTFTIRKPDANSLTVTSPNDGEIWAVGTVQNITWSKSGTTGSYVKLEYSINDGGKWESIEGFALNDESHPWTIPNEASTTCQIRITSTSYSSISDISNNFTIQAEDETITVTNPDSNDTWQSGEQGTITWTGSDSITHVDIMLSKKGASSAWIEKNVPNTGTYVWDPIYAGTTAEYRIDVFAVDSPSQGSSEWFTIRKPATNSLTVTSPNGGEIWDVGSNA